MVNFFKIVVVIFSAQVIGLSSQASAGSSFSAEELSTLSPFSKGVQERVLRDVLALMKVAEDPEISMPEVIISEKVDLSDEELIANIEGQGIPAWALAKGVNMFVLNQNIIVLAERMKIHNLAHEFAHFVQAIYQDADFKNDPMFMLESGAVTIQKHFRSE